MTARKPLLEQAAPATLTVHVGPVSLRGPSVGARKELFELAANGLEGYRQRAIVRTSPIRSRMDEAEDKGVDVAWLDESHLRLPLAHCCWAVSGKKLRFIGHVGMDLTRKSEAI